MMLAGEGGGAESSAAGGLRRRAVREEMVVAGGSSKIHIILCFKTWCSGPSDNTCYCCQTLQGTCFWEQHQCWMYCPSQRRCHQLAAPSAAPATASSSAVGEPQYKSVRRLRAVPDGTSQGDNL